MSVLAAAALLAALAGMTVACLRAATVPVDVDLGAEAALLALWDWDRDLAARWLQQQPLELSWFALPEHQVAARQLQAGTALDPLPSTVRAAHHDRDALAGHCWRAAAALDAADDSDADVADLLVAVAPYGQVRAAWEGRELLTGAADNTVRDDCGVACWPLRRRTVRPDVAAVVVAATAATAALAVWAVAGTGAWSVAVWAVGWVAFATLIALVDWWTMWVDMPTVYLWVALSTVAVVAVTLEVGHIPWLPVVVAAGTVVPFEVGGWWFRRFRGVDAHGAGDTAAIPLFLAPWLTLTWLHSPDWASSSWQAATLVQHAAGSLVVAAGVMVALKLVWRSARDGAAQLPFLPAWVVAAPAGAALTQAVA